MKKILAFAVILSLSVSINVSAQIQSEVPQDEQNGAEPSAEYVYEDFNGGDTSEKDFYRIGSRYDSDIHKTYSSDFYSQKGREYDLTAENYNNNNTLLSAAYPYGWNPSNSNGTVTSNAGKIAWLGDDEDGYFGYSGRDTADKNNMWNLLGTTGAGDLDGYYTLHQFLKLDTTAECDDTIVISYDYQTSEKDWEGNLPSWWTTENPLNKYHPITVQISNFYTNHMGALRGGNYFNQGLLRTPYIYTRNGKVIAQFCAGNGLDEPFPKSTDIVDLQSYDPNWVTATKTHVTTAALDNVNPGDWISVQTVIKRKPDWQYEIRYYVNGQLLVGENTENKTVEGAWWYTPAATNCRAVEYYWKNGFPSGETTLEKYRGLGLTIRGFTYDNDTWQGLDNINMRYYGTTGLPLSARCESDEIEIPFENSRYAGSNAPAAVKAGIADISEASVKAYMYDKEDTFMQNGTEVTTIKIDKRKTSRTATMPSGEVKSMNVNRDGSVLKLTGIPEIEDGKRLVVTLKDAKDILGENLSNNTIALYSGDGSNIGLLTYTMQDVYGNSVVPGKDGKVMSAVKMLKFATTDTYDKGMSLYKADDRTAPVANAVFGGGVYTIDLDYGSLLETGTKYVVANSETETAMFETDDTEITYGERVIADGIASVRYANNGKSDKEIMFVASSFNEYGEGTDTVCEKKTLKAHTSEVLSLAALKEAHEQKAYIWEVMDIGNAELTETAVSIPKYFDENNKNEISGTAEPQAAAELAIFNDSGEMVYANELTADSEGKYGANIDFSGYATGKYTLAMRCGDKLYKNYKAYSADSTDALGKFNTAASAAEISGYITEYNNELELDYGIYDKLANKSAVAEKLKKYIESNGAFASKGSLVRVFRQLCIMQAFAEKSIITNIETVLDDIIEIQSGSLQKWYYNTAREITPARMGEWYASITGNMNTTSDIPSFEEFKKELVCSVVFAAIKNPGNKNNIYNILNDFSNDIVSGSSKLNMSDLTDSVLSKLSGTTLTGFDCGSLLAAIKQYKDGSGTSSGIGGGSSGGSSSGSKIGSVSIGGSIGIIDNPKPIPDEIQYAFEDMNEAQWANDAVKELLNGGIVSGDESGRFNPNSNITRAEFIKMIVGAVQKDAESKEMKFSDVGENDWFYPYILNAYGRGIVNGLPDGSFGSNLPISRQDIAVIIDNIMKESEKNADEKSAKSFADGEEIAGYARAAVENISAAAIINGYEDGSFRPENNATRAEAAMIVYKLLAYLK